MTEAIDRQDVYESLYESRHVVLWPRLYMLAGRCVTVLMSQYRLWWIQISKLTAELLDVPLVEVMHA